MANHAQALPAVSETQVVAANPMGLDYSAMGVDELLTTADSLGGTMYQVVRIAALKAASEPYELDATKPATADARAKAIREKHRATLNKLSATNKNNISAWFADFLVLHFAPIDAKLEIAAPKGDKGAVITDPASAINMAKNTMRTAASRVREQEGTGRDRTPKADTKADTPQPAEISAEVAFWHQLEKKLASVDGLNEFQKHLAPLGYILVTRGEVLPDEPEAKVEPKKPTRAKK